MSGGIVAMDVDLHKIYAVSDTKTILAKAEESALYVARAICAANPATLLIEVSSPILYMNDNVTWKEAKGQVINRLRWALWNISVASYMDETLDRTPVLVAPSHVWTKGHDLKLRHEVAGCTHKQKDLRECEAMIFYYQHSPESWIPLAQYLQEL